MSLILVLKDQIIVLRKVPPGQSPLRLRLIPVRQGKGGYRYLTSV